MDQAVNLDFLIKLVRKYWLSIVVCTFVGILVAAGITFKIMRPRYQSNVQILVSRRSENAAAQYTTQQADVQMITTYKELITNPVILNPVIKHLNESFDYSYSLEALQKAISVSSTQNSQVFSVKVTDRNRIHSARIANQIAQDFKTQVKGIIKVNNVTIVSPAMPGKSPVSPKKGLNLLIGLIAGFLFGMGYAAVRVLTDRRVQGLGYLTDELGLSVLGQVNHHQQFHQSQVVEQLKKVQRKRSVYNTGESPETAAEKRV
ncbi:YveK family protein [Lactiplantibacillus daoliensis]|uniref:Capsular polysaccharide biosynthesis protein CpsC n=1 Tax=Lactiplantibacillus daoliensis TaxID=2559916 RepID=A0ABW1UHH1_9LACO|nr:Wzz/FepE/Etk N-terminal domain-containing protein [Lactiplantibacillus daoliensis]